MQNTGTSSPASGGEHFISNTLCMVAVRDGKKHDLHGRQVGVSSILIILAKLVDTAKPYPFPLSRRP